MQLINTKPLGQDRTQLRTLAGVCILIKSYAILSTAQPSRVHSHHLGTRHTGFPMTFYLRVVAFGSGLYAGRFASS